MIRMSWSYIAGFTDGDGCIHVPKNAMQRPSQIKVTMYQSQPVSYVLDCISEFLAKEGIESRFYLNRSAPTFPSKHLVRVLAVQGAEGVERLLSKLEPFLIVKHKKASEALAILTVAQRGRTYTRKLYCKRGHDLTNPDNYYDREGKGQGLGRGKQCRVCARILDRQRRRTKAVV